MLGGGTFSAQNKVLPGAYQNFVSAATASATLSDRGYVAMPMPLAWGADGVTTVDAADFVKNSKTLFGYAYTSDEMKPLRDLFCHATTAYIYRLNGGGVKASNTYCTAKYTGTRGNSLTTVVAVNADEPEKFDVSTVLDGVTLSTQTVKTAAELVSDGWVDFKPEASLEATAGLKLTNGTDTEVTGTQHQSALDALEAYSFNVIGCLSADPTTRKLYTAWVKRMRDEVGKKCQLVCYKHETADYEGVISVENTVSDSGAQEYDLVYWTAGAEAGCAINKDLTNEKYDGEYTVVCGETQSQLAAAIKAGKLMFHKVGDEVRVLDDVNTFVSVAAEKNEDFQSNQTIRVIDAWANDTAAIFNDRYLGKVQNNQSGRSAYWSDVVTYAKQLESIGAIQEFAAEDISVEQGESKKAVVVNAALNLVGCMKQLYMTTVIH